MVGALALGFDSGRAEQKKMVVNISFTEEKLRIKADYKNIIDVPHFVNLFQSPPWVLPD